MKLPALPVHDPLATMNFERLGASVEPLEVTALPGSPRDGQVIDYVASASAGVIWRLRYRAASTSAYKWEYVGGPPLFSEVVAAEATTSATYADLATVGPSITTPLAGDYDVTIEAVTSNSAASSFTAMSYAIGGTAAVDADDAHVNSQVASQEIIAARARRKAGLAASTALVAKYRTSGTATYSSRAMRVTPVRVG